MGFKAFTIDPSDDNELGGGAEKAVIRLSQEFARLGHYVTVCGPVKTLEQTISKGRVVYLHYSVPLTNNMKITADVAVIWRNNGNVFLQKWKQFFSADRYYLDIHDFMDSKYYEEIKTLNYNCCFVKSKFHYSRNKTIGNDLKFAIIPNGIEQLQIDKIISQQTVPVTKNPQRICFATSLDRGILEMLNKSWPKIKEQVPNAEFHIYYGRLDFIKDQQLRNGLIEAFKQDGVVFHSRVTHQEIIEEFLQSSMYFYISNNIQHEADCIAIREASYCGCVPITCDFGVFSERPGILLPASENIYDAAAEKIVYYMKNPQQLQPYVKFKEHELDWNTVATHWIKMMSP